MQLHKYVHLLPPQPRLFYLRRRMAIWVKIGETNTSAVTMAETTAHPTAPLRPRPAAKRPELTPHDDPVLGPDQHEPGEPRRLQALQLRAELPAPPHRLHHAAGPGLLARLPRHRDRVRHRHVRLDQHRDRVPGLLPRQQIHD